MTIIIGSYLSYQTAKKSYISLTNQVSQGERALIKLTTKKELITRYSASFSELQKNKFYGDEDRLLWGEALKAITKYRQLSSLRYSIGAQQRIENIGQEFSPPLRLSQSMMEINADLGHEGDFIDIIDTLISLPGMVRIVNCNIKKSLKVKIAAEEKNLELTCTLAWLSVSESADINTEINDALDVGEPAQ